MPNMRRMMLGSEYIHMYSMYFITIFDWTTGETGILTLIRGVIDWAFS